MEATDLTSSRFWESDENHIAVSPLCPADSDGLAEFALADLDARAGTSYVAPMLRSWILAHVGDMDGAFAALEAARAERSAPLGFGIRFPIYDRMREDARFRDLLHRMNLQ